MGLEQARFGQTCSTYPIQQNTDKQRMLSEEAAAVRFLSEWGMPMRNLISLSIVLITLAVTMGCQGTSSETTSRTTERPSSFVFTAAGDYGSSKDTTAALDLIARSGASFNLALGDLSYADAPESEWCDYVRSRVGDRVPFQLLPGNHEDDFGEHGHITRFAACCRTGWTLSVIIPRSITSITGAWLDSS